jgi:hypothetical protein
LSRLLCLPKQVKWQTEWQSAFWVACIYLWVLSNGDEDFDDDPDGLLPVDVDVLAVPDGQRWLRRRTTLSLGTAGRLSPVARRLLCNQTRAQSIFAQNYSQRASENIIIRTLENARTHTPSWDANSFNARLHFRLGPVQISDTNALLTKIAPA